MKSKEMESKTLHNLFLKMSHLYFRNCYEQINGLGVHPGQLPMIKLLGEEGQLSQKEISQKLHVKPPTVAVSIKRMEHGGYLKKSSDKADQRVKLISLTEKGQQINQKIKDIMTYNEDVIMRGFAESEQCLLRRFLLQIIHNLEEENHA